MAGLLMDAARFADVPSTPSFMTNVYRGIVWSFRYSHAHRELMRMTPAERRDYDLNDARIHEIAEAYASKAADV